MKLYSPNRAEHILRSLDSDIEGICRMVHLPSAVLKAVLYKEITDIDFFDPLADAIVAFNWQRVYASRTNPVFSGSLTVPPDMGRFLPALLSSRSGLPQHTAL